MIAVVLGMHKSGTTLVAEMLHRSGINMGCSDCTKPYPHCKYEDYRARDICRRILYDGNTRSSIELPYTYHDRTDDIRRYIISRMTEDGSWGFKVPDATLCYDQWQRWLPEHVVIGVQRDYADVLAHYQRRRSPVSERDVERTYRLYNTMLYTIGCPIVRYEEIMAIGPAPVEEIVGRELVDVRR